ncbi:hypothetical protein M0R45_030604 [Rubus argutus]|uniref:Uncharacterized protein n=1 Tax=Rubus argutus TaxID=59490 RepID=A0AAW1WF61_RUBAR
MVVIGAGALIALKSSGKAGHGGSMVRAEERNPRWVSCEPDGIDERRWWLGWDGEDAMAGAVGWALHGSTTWQEGTGNKRRNRGQK